jgi:hypothetical protein
MSHQQVLKAGKTRRGDFIMEMTREIKLELVKALTARESIFTHTYIGRDFLHLVKYGKVDKDNNTLVSLYNGRELTMEFSDSFPSTIKVEGKDLVFFMVNYINGSFSAVLDDSWVNYFFLKIDFEKKVINIKEDTFSHGETMRKYTYKG